MKAKRVNAIKFTLSEKEAKDLQNSLSTMIYDGATSFSSLSLAQQETLVGLSTLLGEL